MEYEIKRNEELLMYMLRKTDSDINFTKGNIYKCKIYDNGMILSTSDNIDDVECKLVEDYKDLKRFNRDFKILETDNNNTSSDKHFKNHKHIVKAYGYILKACKHNVKGNIDLVDDNIYKAISEMREIFREDITIEDYPLQGFREWFMNKEDN